MLTNKRKKEIISLKQKKYRQRYGQFLVEGEKSVSELCSSDYKIDRIYLTPEIREKNPGWLPEEYTEIVGRKEMQQMSNLENPPGILAVAWIPEQNLQSWVPENRFTLMLDNISDPGNLGTLLRIADWYGIKTVLCSQDCVDLYNPKVILASMGSFTRIQVIYCSLQSILQQRKVPSYACVMQGTDIQSLSKPHQGIIVIGNEANGISRELIELSDYRISIPRIGKAESLNAAVAGAIVCHKFVLG